ncbi:MAG: FkbM family methyltransferase [Pseudomonadota bacterium]
MKNVLKTLAASLGYEIRKITHFPQVIGQGDIVEHKIDGHVVRFFVENRFNMIGSAHFAGRFYEAEELEQVRAHARPGGIFVDIGANFGNHALFFALVMQADRVIAFEPGRKARGILGMNIALNDLDDVIQVRRVALSDKTGSAYMKPLFEQNIGSNSVTDDAAGEPVTLDLADNRLPREGISFIKIDVERHEYAVLAGMNEVISASRPVLMIETSVEERDSLTGWARAHDYRTVYELTRHGDIVNVILSPA